MSFVTRASPGVAKPAALGAAYRIIWRWHFYAGLFCLPFIVVLSLSGAVYLFKPQIDAFLDRPSIISPFRARPNRSINRSPPRLRRRPARA